jgi:hypothetical protein
MTLLLDTSLSRRICGSGRDGPSVLFLMASMQQLLKQINHTFFKLIDTLEQPSFQQV